MLVQFPVVESREKRNCFNVSPPLKLLFYLLVLMNGDDMFAVNRLNRCNFCCYSICMNVKRWWCIGGAFVKCRNILLQSNVTGGGAFVKCRNILLQSNVTGGA